MGSATPEDDAHPVMWRIGLLGGTAVELVPGISLAVYSGDTLGLLGRQLLAVR